MYGGQCNFGDELGQGNRFWFFKCQYTRASPLPDNIEEGAGDGWQSLYWQFFFDLSVLPKYRLGDEFLGQWRPERFVNRVAPERLFSNAYQNPRDSINLTIIREIFEVFLPFATFIAPVFPAPPFPGGFQRGLLLRDFRRGHGRPPLVVYTRPQVIRNPPTFNHNGI